MQYWTCPNCNANLDFGERCDYDTKNEAAPRQREAASRDAGVTAHSHGAFSVPHPPGFVKEVYAYA